MKKLTIILISCVLIVSLLSVVQTRVLVTRRSNDSDIKWPEKPITLTLGWAAGGGADLTSSYFPSFRRRYFGTKLLLLIRRFRRRFHL